MQIYERFKPVLHHWFLEAFRQPSLWFERRLSFTRSTAVNSMAGQCCWVLGQCHSLRSVPENCNVHSWRIACRQPSSVGQPQALFVESSAACSEGSLPPLTLCNLPDTSCLAPLASHMVASSYLAHPRDASRPTTVLPNLSMVSMDSPDCSSRARSPPAGYIIGLGDRHSSNILVHKGTAEVAHIDLGIAFEQGRFLNTPEQVPFRLTRDVVDGMGITGWLGTLGSISICSVSCSHLGPGAGNRGVVSEHLRSSCCQTVLLTLLARFSQLMLIETDVPDTWRAYCVDS